LKVLSEESDGYAFEAEVCGCAYIDVDPKHRRQRKIKFPNAIRYVMLIQQKLGCDPCRPKTKLARAVFDRIQNRLKLAGHRERLRFFVCVGTCLDCLGVDCFFKCGNRIVTVDLYSGRMKRKGGQIKADIVLRRSDFVYDHHYQVADRIAEMLLR
jgi:hypothetical protein